MTHHVYCSCLLVKIYPAFLRKFRCQAISIELTLISTSSKLVYQTARRSKAMRLDGQRRSSLKTVAGVNPGSELCWFSKMNANEYQGQHRSWRHQAATLQLQNFHYFKSLQQNRVSASKSTVCFNECMLAAFRNEEQHPLSLSNLDWILEVDRVISLFRSKTETFHVCSQF